MGTPLVLMYHGFGERPKSADPHNLFVSASALESQVRGLLTRGFHALNQETFLSGLQRRSWPRRSFLLTIDDGYVSTLHLAAPVLARLGVPAILFALPGRLGATSAWMSEMPHERLLDADDLRELPQYGITVACHGLDHRSLTGLERDELHRQTGEARVALADVMGYLPQTFAYPFGEHDCAARQAVGVAGFTAGFAIYRADGRLALPRVDVNALDTPRSFALKTSGLYPHAKRLLDGAPTVRRLGHVLVGRARRS